MSESPAVFFVSVTAGRSAVGLGIVDIVVSVPTGYAWYLLRRSG
jgi:hypothetical protein